MADNDGPTIVLSAEDETTPVVAKANDSLAKFEQQARNTHEKYRAWSDQSTTSVKRLVAQLERQTEASLSGVQKEIYGRERLLAQYGKEPAALEAINATYTRRIKLAQEAEAAERKAADAATGGSGFNVRYAFFGVKDIMEGRTKFAVAELGNELTRLRGSALLVGGAVAGIAALGFAAYEVKKHLDEIEEKPSILQAKFERFRDELKTSNDEMQVTNDKLANAIAKLQNKPGNGLKLAIDEAAVAADHLAERLDKSITSFTDLMQKNALTGMDKFAAFFTGGVAGTEDIKQLLGGTTGFGGMRGEVYDAVRAGKNPTGALESYEARVQHMLEVAQNSFNYQQGRPYRTDMGMIEATANQAPRMEVLRALLGEIHDLETSYSLEKKTTSLTERKGVLEDQAAALARVGSSDPVRQLAEAIKQYNERQEKATEKMFEGATKLANQVGYQSPSATPGMGAGWQNELFAFDVANANRNMPYFQYPGLFSRKSQEQQGTELTAEQKQWSEGQLKDDQRHLAMVEKWEQLELSIVKIHTRGDEQAAIERTYQTRLDFARRLYDLESRTVGTVAAGEKLQERQLDAQVQAAQQVLEMQAKQMDALQRTSSGLIHTLLTKPESFPKQFSSTIHEAVLKPVSEGLGGMVANAVHPLIYGENGQGGIAHLFNFGAHQDPVKVSTDLNTSATMQNSTAVMMLTSVLAGYMGVSTPALASPSLPGMGGISMPSISMPSGHAGGSVGALNGSGSGTGFQFGGFGIGGGSAASIPLFSTPALGGFSPAVWSGGSDWGGAASGTGSVGSVSGGMPSAYDLANLPMSHRPSSLNPLALAGLGGGGRDGFSLANIKGSLANLEGTVINQSMWDSTGTSFGAYAGSVLTSPAATTAGMMLGMAGLTGQRRGTVGGIAESTVGLGLAGAGLGAQIGSQIGSVGGPEGALIGAGIGVVAGFGIGLGEKLAGIISPAQKVVQDVRSIYGVSLSTNSGTVKQIVGIAQNQYGGDVAVAVRSPSVRQLIMLYSEATGQHVPLSASTPYGASLVEQGGNLYQQASFSNNAWHTYGSSLPTLGGITGSPYPTPGTPNTSSGTGMSVSLNINGTAITPEFIADGSMAAQNASYGRTQQSANMQVPGLMVG